MADTHIKIKPVTPRVQYTANGSTTVFPYSFAIFDETDMVVYVDDTIITTGYTVSGAGQTDGGEVTFDSPPVDGTIITLLRNVPIERMTDFQEGGTFRPKNLNDEFDRQTAFAQQVQEALSRCVKVDPTSESNPEEILPKVEELYDDIDNINAVAGDLANVDTVAANVSDIGTCATNISDIQAAPGAATTASNAALAAAASASSAAISAAGTHFKLFHHDWFDYELNDMAWLRADTFSWQDGTVYTEAYNHLVADYNGGTSQTETVGSYTITYKLATDGHKITTDETTVANIYTESGVAWYYILDTTNQRFKLPRTKYGFTGLRDTVGKYVEAGLPNITGGFGLRTSLGVSDMESRQSGAFSYELLGDGSSTQSSGSDFGGKIVFDASDSNAIYGNSTTVQPPATQMYLYFYVGQFSQSATEQTAGLNSELFNGKMDRDMSNMNASQVAKEIIVGWGMPDYANMVSGTTGAWGEWIQAQKDSFVLWYGADQYTENVKAYVSPDKTETYLVGKRFDDQNGYTQVTSFGFFVPAGWWFKADFEADNNYYIYPLKGVSQ